jgi:unsaturated rhamnogalacturonyl hydrolase
MYASIWRPLLLLVEFTDRGYLMRTRFAVIGIAVCLFSITLTGVEGQSAPAVHPDSDSFWVGDTPDNPPPLAHLSSDFHPKSIEIAMRKVGDWELEQAQPHFRLDWTFSALYAGFMAAAKTLPDAQYEDAMLQVGNKFDWKLGPRLTHADDQAIAQTYLGLYRDYHEARMIEPTREQFDVLMKTHDDPQKPVWWWCDALFMAPPVWARLYGVTGNKSYLDYMDHEWWITSNLLYDPQEHLYFRDAGYLHKTEANGRKLFWSRGNGWVMAGLARVLEVMPENYPTRQKYVEQYRQMAERVISLQGTDGLWKSGLLDADAYPLSEVSGSAFFVYALAWGINHGILDRVTYLPVVQKGWAGLVSHIYVDGRLGCIQPIGAAPGVFKPSSSYVYGVGAFLLAGSEAHQLAERHRTNHKTPGL